MNDVYTRDIMHALATHTPNTCTGETCAYANHVN